MLTFCFERGLRFLDRSIIWTLTRADHLGRHRYESDNGKVLTLHPADVLARWCDREWIVDDSSVTTKRPSFYLATRQDFESLEEEKQKKPKFIQQCLDFLEKNKVTLTRASVERVMPRLRRHVGDAYSVSVSSILRWAAVWNRGHDLMDFVDKRPGNSGRRRCEVPLSFAERAAARIDGPVATVADFISKVTDEFEKHNQTCKEDERMQVPSRATLYRVGRKVLRAINKESVSGNKLRKNAARRNAIGTVITRRVLERVEIDFHELDLVPISSVTGRPIERAWIIVAIDHFSRMILGFFITINPPHAAAVVECLRHAVLPKNDTLARFPDLQSEYPCAGYPLLITTDNDTATWADVVEQACDQLKVPFRYCPGEMPEMKAYIERFFNTLTHSCIQTAPGSTFSNPEELGNYDPDANAAYDIVLLTERIATFIIDDYHRKKHGGIKKTPLRRWKDSPQLNEIEYPADPQLFDILACEQVERTLQHYGIQDHDCQYNNKVLADLFERLGRTPTRVIVKRPWVIDFVYVLDPMTKHYIRVEIVRGGYNFPMPRLLHEVIRKHLTTEDERKDDEQVRKFAKRKFEHLDEQAKAKKKKLRRKSDQVQQQNSAEIIAERPSVYASMQAVVPVAPHDDEPIKPLDPGLDDDLPQIGALVD